GCITFSNGGDKAAIIRIVHREGFARLSRAVRSVDEKSPDLRHASVSSPAPTITGRRDISSANFDPHGPPPHLIHGLFARSPSHKAGRRRPGRYKGSARRAGC